MKKRHCIVFGGGGFIGSHLVEKLVEKKYPVSVVCRGSEQDYKNLSDVKNKINVIKIDISNYAYIGKIINEGDIVFDLIASSVPFSSMQTPHQEINHHISSHFKLIQAACKKEVAKFIFFSSGGGVYGNKKKLPITEDETLQPVSPHAISKATIEYLLHYFSRIHNIPYIIYRLSNPYGPRQISKKGFAIIPTIFSNVSRNQPPTLFDHGKLIRDYIYIDDLINAITISFNKKTKYPIYNIGSGKGSTLNMLWQNIKKITKAELSPIYIPKRPIDVDTVVLNTNRFKREFDWKPQIKLSSGLKKTWNAYINQIK